MHRCHTDVIVDGDMMMQGGRTGVQNTSRMCYCVTSSNRISGLEQMRGYAICFVDERTNVLYTAVGRTSRGGAAFPRNSQVDEISRCRGIYR